MRDQGRIHGPSGDPVEFLRRRLAEQDRKLDDLYRRLGDKPPKIEPPVSGGGSVEAFRARTIGVSSNSITTGNSANIHFRWNQTGSKQFVTDGVTGLNGSTTDTVSYPAGLWVFYTHLTMVAGTTPTSGYVDTYFSLLNEWQRISWREIADQDDGGEVEHIWIHYAASASTLQVGVDNFTDVTITPSGYFAGWQLPVADTLDTNPT